MGNSQPSSVARIGDYLPWHLAAADCSYPTEPHDFMPAMFHSISALSTFDGRIAQHNVCGVHNIRARQCEWETNYVQENSECRTLSLNNRNRLTQKINILQARFL